MGSVYVQTMNEFCDSKAQNDVLVQQRCTCTELIIFTARCTIVQSAVLRSHVVCLSVCLSVTLVIQDHMGWKS